MKNNKSISVHIAIIFCLRIIVGCDSRVENIVGPYKLTTIDIEEQTYVAYDHGNGSSIVLVPDTVYSIGFNKHYIIAKQHPKGDRNIVNYWYLDIDKYSYNADQKESISGPMNKYEFDKMKIKYGLPEFTRTIKKLE